MKLIGVIFGLAVGIILLGSAIIPALGLFSTDENTLDVIIIDGQSNAAYYPSNTARVNPADVDLPAPKHNLLYYGTEQYINYYSYSGERGIYQMYRDGWIVGGEEPALALGLSEKSDRDVLTINVARGAQSITWLAPGGAGWTYATNCIEDALGKITGYDHLNLLGWVMIQGEADKDMDEATYKSRFMDLSRAFDSLGFGQCYIVNTRPYWGGNATIAQQDLAEHYGNIHIATYATESFTEENGLLVVGDPIHYSQKGRNILGTDLAEYIPDSASLTIDDSLLYAIPIITIAGFVAIAAGIVLKRPF